MFLCHMQFARLIRINPLFQLTSRVNIAPEHEKQSYQHKSNSSQNQDHINRLKLRGRCIEAPDQIQKRSLKYTCAAKQEHLDPGAPHLTHENISQLCTRLTRWHTANRSRAHTLLRHAYLLLRKNMLLHPLLKIAAHFIHPFCAHVFQWEEIMEITFQIHHQHGPHLARLHNPLPRHVGFRSSPGSLDHHPRFRQRHKPIPNIRLSA